MLLYSPSHSLILDTSDACWKDIFTPEKISEIETYERKVLECLPKDLEKYIKSYSNIAGVDALFQKTKADISHPQENPSCEWAQSTLYNSLKLFMLNLTPNFDQSEAGLLRQVWSPIDTLFYDSVIESKR